MAFVDAACTLVCTRRSIHRRTAIPKTLRQIPSLPRNDADILLTSAIYRFCGHGVTCLSPVAPACRPAGTSDAWKLPAPHGLCTRFRHPRGFLCTKLVEWKERSAYHPRLCRIWTSTNLEHRLVEILRPIWLSYIPRVLCLLLRLAAILDAALACDRCRHGLGLAAWWLSLRADPAGREG